jgi:hypothetical protein
MRDDGRRGGRSRPGRNLRRVAALVHQGVEADGSSGWALLNRGRFPRRMAPGGS